MKKKAFFTMLAVVLVLVLSLTVFVACNKDKKDNTGETPATYSVTVNGGTGGGEYTAGATVTITANAPATGKEFTSWTIEGVTVDDKTNAEITFTMPANAVTATANFGDKAYLFALENCTADKESAKFGEEVTFTADEITGKRFDSWNIKGVDDLTGLDLTKSPLTITMPANDINVAAQLEQLYKITVLGGCTADKEWAAAGEQVTVTKPTPPEGHTSYWWSTGITQDWSNRENTVTFTMPAGDVQISASKLLLNYLFTMVGGTATGVKSGEPNTVTDGRSNGFDYGTDVTITANEPETGKRFTGWTITGVDTSELVLTDKELTFTMPANKVTATANYEYIDYTVSVTGGTANKTTAHYGDSITITAAAPETGKKFTSWTLNGVTVEDTSLTELTFEMPANNVTATANYDFIDYTVTVNGGTADKATAHYGDTVTITANEPGTNKEFIGWNSPNGVVFNDNTSIETTFTMPASNVTVNAVFRDIKYSVFVNYDAGGAASDSQRAYCGDPVTITAKDIEGRIFVRWEITRLDTEGLDLTKSTLTFTMPENNVTANAIYEDLITLTFEGNIAQSERLTYRKGASKTFRIELGDSQEFCEYDISLTNKSCTFKVYDSLGNEIEPTDNGDGSMRIAVNRQDTYTIRVTYEGTSSTTQCAIKITASSPTV